MRLDGCVSYSHQEAHQSCTHALTRTALPAMLVLKRGRACFLFHASMSVQGPKALQTRRNITTTPQDLVSDGLYAKDLAVELFAAPFRELSLAIAARKLSTQPPRSGWRVLRFGLPRAS
eukprot:735196-Pleurochrysis_carterae.AAC.3